MAPALPWCSKLCRQPIPRVGALRLSEADPGVAGGAAPTQPCLTRSPSSDVPVPSLVPSVGPRWEEMGTSYTPCLRGPVLSAAPGLWPRALACLGGSVPALGPFVPYLCGSGCAQGRPGDLVALDCSSRPRVVRSGRVQGPGCRDDFRPRLALSPRLLRGLPGASAALMLVSGKPGLPTRAFPTSPLSFLRGPGRWHLGANLCGSEAFGTQPWWQVRGAAAGSAGQGWSLARRCPPHVPCPQVLSVGWGTGCHHVARVVGDRQLGPGPSPACTPPAAAARPPPSSGPGQALAHLRCLNPRCRAQAVFRSQPWPRLSRPRGHGPAGTGRGGSELRCHPSLHMWHCWGDFPPHPLSWADPTSRG